MTIIFLLAGFFSVFSHGSGRTILGADAQQASIATKPNQETFSSLSIELVDYLLKERSKD